jgi:hypothetical protein
MEKVIASCDGRKGRNQMNRRSLLGGEIFYGPQPQVFFLGRALTFPGVTLLNVLTFPDVTLLNVIQ